MRCDSTMGAAGEILTTDETIDMAAWPAEGLDRRHLQLKGRSEPVDVVVLSHATP